MTPVVNVIYCDDIREEVGGKSSLMGVYNSEFRSNNMPFVIPKLCMQIHIRVPVEMPPIDLKLDIVIGDTLLGQSFIGKSEVQQMLEEMANGDMKFVVIGFIFTHFQLVIENDTKIRVVATLGEERYTGNGLKICKFAAPDTITSATSPRKPLPKPARTKSRPAVPKKAASSQ